MPMALGLQNKRNMTTAIHKRLADSMAFLSLDETHGARAPSGNKANTS